MRKAFSQRTIFTSLLLILIFTVAACGGSKEPTPTPVPPTATPEPAPAVVGDAAVGEKVYQATCIACHGPDAKGVANLGKSLHPSDSDFVSTRTDDELVSISKSVAALMIHSTQRALICRRRGAIRP